MMRRILTIAVGLMGLVYSGVAQAQYYHQPRHHQPRVYHHHYHHHHYHQRNHRWVPYVAGGLALGAIGAGVYTYCRIERHPVYDQWGNYAGSRKLRICH